MWLNTKRGDYVWVTWAWFRIPKLVYKLYMAIFFQVLPRSNFVSICPPIQLPVSTTFYFRSDRYLVIPHCSYHYPSCFQITVVKRNKIEASFICYMLCASWNLETLNTILSGTNHIWAASPILAAAQILLIRPMDTYVKSLQYNSNFL